MKCWKCGSEITDDSVFCENCGTKVELVESADVEQETLQQQVNVEQQSTPVQNVQPEPPKKKKPMGILVIGAVIVLIAVLVLLVSKLFGGSSNANDKQLVYIKGSSIYYTDNMDKDKDPIRICRVSGDDDYWNNLELTDDGKYLYYYSKINAGGTGTLCRAELAKLSGNEEKNEKYIVEISSNVEDYLVLAESNVVVYLKENGKLLIYDGKEEIDIAKNTDSFSVSVDQKIVFYTKYNDSTGETAYYYYNIAKNETEKLTDALYGYARWDATEDFVVYRTDEGDAGEDLYVANTSGENEKIDSDVYTICDSDSDTKSIYYMVERTEKKKAYDYVNDPYAEADADLTEPDIRDYLSTITEREAMSEDDYEYYCIDWPEDKIYFYQWLDYDSELELYYYGKYEEDAYGNGEWYDCYYSDVLNQWYVLDDDGFWDAYDNYSGAEDRIELREELKDETIEITLYDLYYWKDGKEPVLIAESVIGDSVWTDAENNLAIYEKESEVSISVSIDDVYSAYEVSWQIEDAMWNTESERERAYYCTVGDKETSLDVDQEINSMQIASNGKSVVLELIEDDSDRILNQYSLTGKGLEFKAEIADDAVAGNWVGDVYYYYKDVDSEYYGTLYQYENGKSEKLVSNVYTSVVMYADGNYRAVKEQSSYDESDVRVYCKNGDEIKFKSISDFAYISEDRIIYMKNDSLYVYRGKDEDRRIDRNVEQFQCVEEYGITL